MAAHQTSAIADLPMGDQPAMEIHRQAMSNPTAAAAPAFSATESSRINDAMTDADAPSSSTAKPSPRRPRHTSSFQPLVPTLPTLQRWLCEPAAYSRAAACSFHAYLHASPSRRLNVGTTAGSLRRENSQSGGAILSAARPSGPQPLSYSAEQAHIHDALAFMHTLSRALRFPVKVTADASLSLLKYCALFPVQRQAFPLAPTNAEEGGSGGGTPSAASPAQDPSSTSTSQVNSLTPPHSLYSLSTSALFLACKSTDTPRRLNDFVDAHLALAQAVQRARLKVKEREKEAAASAASSSSGAPRKKSTALSAIERVKTVWKEVAAGTEKAMLDVQNNAYINPALVGFNPLTLSFPSNSSSFTPSHEWTHLRANLVYLEFVVLTYATEFGGNNATTGGLGEEQDGTVYDIVERLLEEMTEPSATEERKSELPVSLPYPSPALAEQISKLVWILTHAAVRSTVYLHSNAYVVAIAIVHLASQRFRPSSAAATPAAAPPSAALPSIAENPSAAADSVPATPVDPAASPMTPMAVDLPYAVPATLPANDAASSTVPEESLDLNAIAQHKGWIPSRIVVDSNDAPMQHAQWYHALCPSLSPAILLPLCELILESALAMPNPPASSAETRKSEASMQGEVEQLATMWPWTLTAETQGDAFPWSQHVEVIIAQSSDEVQPYEEPYPFPERLPRDPISLDEEPLSTVSATTPVEDAPASSSSRHHSRRHRSKEREERDSSSGRKHSKRSKDDKRDRDSSRKDRKRSKDKRRDHSRERSSRRRDEEEEKKNVSMNDAVDLPRPHAPSHSAPAPVAVHAPVASATPSARASRWGKPVPDHAILPIVDDSSAPAMNGRLSMPPAPLLHQTGAPTTAVPPSAAPSSASHPVSRNDLSNAHRPAWMNAMNPSTAGQASSHSTATEQKEAPSVQSSTLSQLTKDQLRKQRAAEAFGMTTGMINSSTQSAGLLPLPPMPPQPVLPSPTTTNAAPFNSYPPTRTTPPRPVAPFASAASNQPRLPSPSSGSRTLLPAQASRSRDRDAYERGRPVDDRSRSRSRGRLEREREYERSSRGGREYDRDYDRPRYANVRSRSRDRYPSSERDRRPAPSSSSSSSDYHGKRRFEEMSRSDAERDHARQRDRPQVVPRGGAEASRGYDDRPRERGGQRR
jgi:hypothetical protein